MHRDKYTEKLVRILKTLDAGQLPTEPTELYVFGSYSRGAIEPGDLDLILIHKSNREEYLKRKTAELVAQGMYDWEAEAKACRSQEKDIRAALMKRGESIQILLGEALEMFVGGGSRIKPSDPILLWSKNDRDWQPKLSAIKPDESAGRAPRNHLVELKRLHCSVSAMEGVVEMIEQELLKLTRIPIESIDVKLNAFHKGRLEWWAQRRVLGKDSFGTLPYAMWWLQQHRQSCHVPNRTEIWSERFTHRIELGRPSLRWMVHYFETRPKLKRQCLIPHFKSKGPNELLIFERGPKWREWNQKHELQKKFSRGW